MKCLDYMYSQLPMYHRIGPAAYKTDLTNTVKLCEHFNNPQNKLKFVHIAGTNGKTSSSHFVASILHCAGYKVGLYTSPHLVDFRERILVDGKMIDKEFVYNFVENNKDVFAEIKPSFFEMTVALAFLYFVEQNVDYAVVEVGLGGRLDSTNIITPLVSTITNIGLDHCQFLGNTLPEIAHEKAGIIKKHVPVIIGETQDETTNVFLAKAKEESAPIIFADQNYHVDNVVQTFDSLKFNVTSSITGEKYEVDSALKGHYEIKNIVTVVATIEELQKQIDIPKQAVIDGLHTSLLRGRWDIIGRNPLIVCDTGHNAEGIIETLTMINYVEYNKLHIVFGVVEDKKLDVTLQILPKNASYYLCRPNIPRGLDVKILQKKMNEAGIDGNVYASCDEALDTAIANADANDMIYVGGSSFVVAEILSNNILKSKKLQTKQ